MTAKPDAPWPVAVIEALRFRDASTAALAEIAQKDWKNLLANTDEAQMTLPLALRCADAFPGDARDRLSQALARNELRNREVIRSYEEIAHEFGRRGIEFIVLKGFSQWPWWVDEPSHRFQNDLDFYCSPASIEPAKQILISLGYQARGKPETSGDHLPTMVRTRGWAWNGDYYDPARPPFVELHFRLWDAAHEGFDVPGTQSFFDRRMLRDLCGISVPALSVADGLTYSTMHLVRHLLRGDLKLRHAYELAHFLERSAGDDVFWNEWRRHCGGSVTVAGIAFRLASEWFGCHMHAAPEEVVSALPDRVHRWFRLFCLAPVTRNCSPNKHEVWLHLCLVPDRLRRLEILRRRLLPAHVPQWLLDAEAPDAEQGALSRAAATATFAAARAVHHLRTVVPFVRSGLRWHFTPE